MKALVVYDSVHGNTEAIARAIAAAAGKAPIRTLKAAQATNGDLVGLELNDRPIDFWAKVAQVGLHGERVGYEGCGGAVSSPGELPLHGSLPTRHHHPSSKTRA